MKNVFKFKSKIWIWPGDYGWHFITLPKEIYTKIRKYYPKGFVKIEARINKTSWNTSLFPHKASGYLLCINKKIRNKECLFVGDEIVVNLIIL